MSKEVKPLFVWDDETGIGCLNDGTERLACHPGILCGFTIFITIGEYVFENTKYLHTKFPDSGSAKFIAEAIMTNLARELGWIE